MIELVVDGREGFGDVGVVHDPAQIRVEGAFYDEIKGVAVSVQACGVVRVGSVVCGFELKCFDEVELWHRGYCTG